MSNSAILANMRARYDSFIAKRRAFDSGVRNWFTVSEKSTDETEVFIYDAIGMWGVEAFDFVDVFEQITTPRINLRVNSPGGSVYDGMAIYNVIKRHNSTVTAEIDGLAASMASLIVLAADTVKMHEFGMFMIHEPWSMVMGSADDMRSEAAMLDKIMDQGVEVYRVGSNLPATEIRAAMAAETWYSAEEAKEAGFVHEIIPNEGNPKELITFDLSLFNNVPKPFQRNPDGARDAMPDRRTVEIALRDAGLSRREAKALISEGYNNGDGVRDVRHDVIGQHLNDLLRSINRK